MNLIFSQVAALRGWHSLAVAFYNLGRDCRHAKYNPHHHKASVCHLALQLKDGQCAQLTFFGQHPLPNIVIMAQQLSSGSLAAAQEYRTCSGSMDCLRGPPLRARQALRQPFRGSRQRSILVRAQAGERPKQL